MRQAIAGGAAKRYDIPGVLKHIRTEEVGRIVRDVDSGFVHAGDRIGVNADRHSPGGFGEISIATEGAGEALGDLTSDGIPRANKQYPDFIHSLYCLFQVR